MMQNTTLFLVFFFDKFSITNKQLLEIQNECDSFNNYIASLSEPHIFPKSVNDIYDAQNKKFIIGNDFKLIKNNQKGLQSLINVNILKNSILRVANELLSYYESRMHPGCELNFTKIIPIVSINKSVFSKGETLEITAGLGVSSLNNTINSIDNCEMFIDKKKYNINNGEFRIVEFVNLNKLGKFNKTISFTFKDPNTGDTKMVNKTITYEVQ